jgi:hypothetical protein
MQKQLEKRQLVLVEVAFSGVLAALFAVATLMVQIDLLTS